MKRKRLLASDHTLVLEMFEAGISQTRIADSLDVPVGAVGKVVKEKYPDFVGRVYIPEKEIAAKYKAGKTLSQIADEYNTTSNTIRSRLANLGIEIMSAAEQQRKHFFNDKFFNAVDSSKKAYWLGFFFADGMVMSTRKDSVISLARKDRGHLEKFLLDIDYVGPGGISDLSGNGYGNKVIEYSRVSLRSENMWNDLISHGCIPNKSLDLGPPMGLPSQFKNDFIRGVVDGDGYLSKQGLPAIEIVGSY